MLQVLFTLHNAKAAVHINELIHIVASVSLHHGFLASLRSYMTPKLCERTFYILGTDGYVN